MIKDDVIIVNCMGCKYFSIIRNGGERYLYCSNEKRWKETHGYFKHGGLMCISEYDKLANKLFEKIIDEKYNTNCKHKEVQDEQHNNSD